MERATAMTEVQKAQAVQKRLGLYRGVCCLLSALVLSVIILLGAQAAPSPAPQPETIRATRLEIVNETGQVVLRAEARQSGGTLQLWNTEGKLGFAMHATPMGGYLEIFDGTETALFTVGKTPTQQLPGHWERLEHAVDQQNRELHQLLRRVDTLESRGRTATALERPDRSVEDLRRDVEQQRRELDQQRRQLDAAERQLRNLERR